MSDIVILFIITRCRVRKKVGDAMICSESLRSPFALNRVILVTFAAIIRKEEGSDSDLGALISVSLRLQYSSYETLSV